MMRADLYEIPEARQLNDPHYTSEPDDLEGEFLRILPQLAVCSRPTKLVEREAPAWVELYPGGASHAVVKSLDGSRRTLPTMDFDTLLSILDGI